jgi:hypothetical protein
MCDAGKRAASAILCDNNAPLANCTNTYFATTQKCWYPATGYSVAKDLASAVTFSADNNCRVLETATQCGICADGYWWDSEKCQLSAKLLGAAFLAVVALFIN